MRRKLFYLFNFLLLFSYKAHPDITIIKSSDTNLNIMRNSDHKIIFSLETEEEIVFVYSQDENDNYYRNLLATTFHFLEQDLVFIRIIIAISL